MGTLQRVAGLVLGRGALFVLGGGYLAFGIALGVAQALQGEPIAEIVIDQLLLFVIGSSLVGGAVWLGRTDIRPNHFPLITLWTLAGFGLMFGVVLLYDVNPVTSVGSPQQSYPILSGFGAVAGYGLGIHRARAVELEETKRELEQTIVELEGSNARLEQFGRAVSHDLKQPLRTTTVNLEMIDDRGRDALDAEEQEMLTDAIDSSTRMREMIDGLLEYARLDAETTTGERVDLAAVIGDVLADLDAMIEARGAEISVAELPTVRGNEEQLYQVLLNLVENAIKYSEDTPEVSIGAERTITGWRISVSDRGIGIADGEAERIFGLFQRSHRAEAYEGVGLGLAMCKQIVEQHGGEIQVDSTPGQGSTFSITLPIREQPVGEPPLDVLRPW